MPADKKSADGSVLRKVVWRQAGFGKERGGNLR